LYNKKLYISPIQMANPTSKSTDKLNVDKGKS